MIGNMSEEVLKAFIETIPIEFSMLDENNEVMCWNKHTTRIFRRPEGALGMNVKQCHPEKSLGKVEQIISEMKDGSRDKARFWIDLGEGEAKRKVMIEYYALRSSAGKYLGCLEASQDITDIKAIEGQKRILD